jgi:hypothetical protein
MTRCSITCQEPGGSNKIYYETDPEHGDYEHFVPMYCERHRTEEGRHSQTRAVRR